jgi:hypothetical protein
MNVFVFVSELPARQSMALKAMYQNDGFESITAAVELGGFNDGVMTSNIQSDKFITLIFFGNCKMN